MVWKKHGPLAYSSVEAESSTGRFTRLLTSARRASLNFKMRQETSWTSTNEDGTSNHFVNDQVLGDVRRAEDGLPAHRNLRSAVAFTSRSTPPRHGQQAGLAESGSKLPHSKELRAFSCTVTGQRLTENGRLKTEHGGLREGRFQLSSRLANHEHAPEAKTANAGAGKLTHYPAPPEFDRPASMV